MSPNYKETEIQFGEATYIKDGKGYAIPFNLNGLFKVDLNEKTCEYIHFFMDEPALIENLYTNIVEYKDKLIFIPGSAENLVIFDPTKDEYKTIKVISDRLNGWDHYEKYAGCVEHNGKLYFPGERYSFVLKLDPNTGETTFIDIPDEESVWTRHAIIKEGGIIKVPSSNTSRLLTFNLQTEKVHIQETFNLEKMMPELKRIEASVFEKIHGIDSMQLEIKGGMEMYYESFFKSFAKETGRMVIKEDDGRISFNDIVDYVEWEKTR